MTILDPKPVTTAAIDGVVRDKINQAGSATQVALSATYGPTATPMTAAFEPLRNTAQPLRASLPRLTKALSSYNDFTDPTIRVIGLGSSVGVGATLPTPDTQAPVARLFSQLSPAINRLGNVTLTKTNGSVNGSTIIEGAETHYAAAKTTAGGAPSLVVLAYGMNDGQSPLYHNGQTFPAVYTQGKRLVDMANLDGADVIIMTTPHPHTGRNPWGMGAVPSTYPTTTPVPTADAAGSIVNVTTDSGAVVPASYRHLRVNESLRQLAADTGSVLLDAEKHWFNAVAANGENALFDTNEYAHPNLLGHQLSYWKAIDDLVRSYSRSTVAAGAAPTTTVPTLKYKSANTAYTSTTTLTNDTQLAFEVGPNQVWEVTVSAFYTGSAGDMRIGLSLPSGSAGRAGVRGPAPDAVGYNSHPATSRSTGLPDTYGLPVGGTSADSYATFDALVRVGSTGGTITAQFCQDTSSATTTTVYADTHLRAVRVT